MIRIDHKPISVNKAYTGKRYNTPEHRNWNNYVIWLLPNIKLPEPPFEIFFKFGLSSLNADWDNNIKTTQDLLATKYKFNDKLIRKGTVETEIVPKGKEYFEFEILHYEK